MLDASDEIEVGEAMREALRDAVRDGVVKLEGSTIVGVGSVTFPPMRLLADRLQTELGRRGLRIVREGDALDDESSNDESIESYKPTYNLLR